MYKLGDSVCTEDKLHGHDSRVIHGVIGDIKTDESGDTYYRIDWNGGGYDYLYPCKFDVLTTYRVYFTDVKDGCPNQKLLESASVQDIYDYMAYLGHTDVKVEPITNIAVV